MLNLVIFSILSGICYRVGGIGEPYSGKWRDWGCSFLTLVYLFLEGHQFNVIVYLVSFLLLWGFTSTYWKKGEDCAWWNWWLHGFGIGIGLAPFCFIGIPWQLVLVRAIVLGTLMMVVSEKSDDVWVEEFSRGAFIILTLPLLGV